MSWIGSEISLTLKRSTRNPVRWAGKAAVIGLALVCVTLLSSLWRTPGRGRERWPDAPLYELVRQTSNRKSALFSYPEYSTLSASRNLSAAAFAPFHGSLHIDGTPVPTKMTGGLYSPGFFELNRVSPLLGRLVDSGSDPAGTVVLSYRFWRRSFPNRDDVIGRRLKVNRAWFTVVAVLPESFISNVLGFAPDVWLSLQDHAAVVQAPSALREKVGNADLRTVAAYSWLTILARPVPGLGAAGAVTEAAAALGDQKSTGLRLDVLDGRTLPLALRDIGTSAAGVAKVVLSLVLIAAAVTVIVVAAQRAAVEASESALRRALGASRRHAFASVIVREAVVWLPAIAVGILINDGLLRLLSTVLPASVDLTDAPLDEGVAALSRIAIAGGGGILLSVTIGALYDIRRSPGIGVGPVRRKVSALAMGGEVLVCTVLAAATTLFAFDLYKVSKRPIGFDPNNLASMRVNLDFTGLEGPAIAAEYDKLLGRLGDLPEVQAVALASVAPLPTPQDVFAVAPRPPVIMIRTIAVSRNYFDVLRQPLLVGRNLDAATTPPSMVLNRTAAERALKRPGATISDLATLIGRIVDEATIVGVVEDARRDDLSTKPEPTEYTLWPGPLARASFLIRSNDRAAFDQRVAGLLGDAPPGGWIEPPLWLSEAVAVHQWRQRGGLILCGICALVTLLFMAFSIHAVVRETIEARRRELMIRMALGAQPSRILARSLSQVAVVTAVAAIAGAVLSGALANSASALLEAGASIPRAVTLGALSAFCVSLAAGAVPLLRVLRHGGSELLRAPRA